MQYTEILDIKGILKDSFIRMRNQTSRLSRFFGKLVSEPGLWERITTVGQVTKPELITTEWLLDSGNKL